MAAVREAWQAAADQLVGEAALRTVEELARQARAIRDVLDPVGAQARFDARYEARSVRIWTDDEGVRHASIRFDDLGGAWMTSAIDAAMRPRRGGPRFVDPDEKQQAEELTSDPRTNDQLVYDLFIDLLRAGALADARSVFGAKQAGVHVVTIVDPADGDPDADHTARRTAEGHSVTLVEETGDVVPAWIADLHACGTSTTDCTLDAAGDPLYLGREARLFTPKQKLALTLRDGGCRWHGCDRPAHYCESHHIDEFAKGGRTDVDRGILLCRFHHMQLHRGGWRITREGRGDFLLHPPGGQTPMRLRPRLDRGYLWGAVEPPPKRFRQAA